MTPRSKKKRLLRPSSLTLHDRDAGRYQATLRGYHVAVTKAQRCFRPAARRTYLDCSHYR